MPGDPAGLRQASAALARCAERLAAHGEEAGARAAEASSDWSGAASLAFDGAAEAMRRASGHAAAQLRGVSVAVRRHADLLEEAHARVRAAAAREEQHRLEALRWSAASGSGAPEPTAALLAQAAAEEALSARSLGDRARAECAAGGQALARVLRDCDPEAAVACGLGDLGALWPLRGIVADAAKAARQGAATATLWDYALTARRISAAAGGSPLLAGGRAERALGRASARAGEALARLHGGPIGAGGAGAARAVWGRIGLGATLVGGASDLIHGEEGHGGARSLATRAFGGLAAAGSGALLAQGAGFAVAGGPVTLAVAGTAVTAYGVWKVGTAIYDHRAAIARAATTVVRGAGGAAREAARRLANGPETVGGALGHGARQVHDAARGFGERLQGLRPLVGPSGGPP